jgi:hypothetical protein
VQAYVLNLAVTCAGVLLVKAQIPLCWRNWCRHVCCILAPANKLQQQQRVLPGFRACKGHLPVASTQPMYKLSLALPCMYPLQNADDNKYSSSVSCPMLELVLTSGAVSLLNNERGFSVRDVRGISDIGKSKKKGKGGYTGAVRSEIEIQVSVSDNVYDHSTVCLTEFSCNIG